MKILHTSDWHLGRQFHNVSLLDDQRFIVRQIADIAAAEKVDAIVIAGDLYDRSVPPAEAMTILDDFLVSVSTQLNIPVIIISGNHDGAERLAYASRLLRQNQVYVYTDLSSALTPLCIADCCFYPLVYSDPSTVSQLSGLSLTTHQQAMQWLMGEISADLDTQKTNILISHCFVAGSTVSDSERPLSIGGAEQVDPALFEAFDYVALGHLHGAQYRHRQTVRYSGSILKYSFSEVNHCKSVTIVDVDNGVSTKNIPLKPQRDMRVIEAYLDDVLEQAATDEAKDDYLLVRLLDKMAILDVMAKLRDVYPNVLHLERLQHQPDGINTQSARAHLQQSELDMFGAFYKEISDQELDENMQKDLSELIDGLHKGEQN